MSLKKSLLLLAITMISAGLVACGDGPGTGITTADGASGVYTGPTGTAAITQDNADAVLAAMRFSTLMLPFNVASMVSPTVGAESNSELSAKEMGSYLAMVLGKAVDQLPLPVSMPALGVTTTFSGTVESPLGGSFTWTIYGIYPGDTAPPNPTEFPPYYADARIVFDNFVIPMEGFIGDPKPLTQAQALSSFVPGPIVNGSARLKITMDPDYVESISSDLVVADALTASAAEVAVSAASIGPRIPVRSFEATVNQFSIYQAGVVNVLAAGLVGFVNDSNEQYPVNYTVRTGIDFTNQETGFSFRDQAVTILKAGWSDELFNSLFLGPALTDSAATTLPEPDVIFFTSYGKLWSTLIGGAVSYAFTVDLGIDPPDTISVTCQITGQGGSSIRMSLDKETFIAYQMANPDSYVIPVKVELDPDGDGVYQYQTVRPLFDFSGFFRLPR